MATAAVIPIRSFRGGKKRLSSNLDPEGRAAFGEALAGHVVEASREAGFETLVVTGDRDVKDWATSIGSRVCGEPGSGLDAAARSGVDDARKWSDAWVVLHADLPLLQAKELGRILEAMSSGSDVIAPSADGGTSALSTRNPIEFRYGVGSFRRHLQRLETPDVIVAPGLLFDVDSGDDIESVRTHPKGSWIEPFLADQGV